MSDPLSQDSCHLKKVADRSGWSPRGLHPERRLMFTPHIPVWGRRRLTCSIQICSRMR